jgi:autophagy-related protein 11
LASLTGVPLGDQLLLFAGQKLEPTKPLGTYGLPEASGTAAPGPQSVHGDQTQHVDEKPRHVFLYCKSLLRPDAPAPPEEPFEHVPIDPPPPAPPRSDGTHPLDAASSPLIRALPDYERQFRHHRQSAAAVWRATQARFEECRRLVTEMHVQALAIDSARDNVDHHFNYICRCQGEFERTHAAQNAAHSELLQCFDADMETLENTGLHPAVIEHCARRHEEAKKAAEGETVELEGKVDGGDKLQSHGAADVSSVTGSGSSANESAGDIGSVNNVVSSTESTGSAGGEGNPNPKPQSAPASPSRPASVPASVTVPPCRKNLLDCIPAERVRRWAQDCARSHDAFNAKVNDLSDMFNALHATTEELFMTGPDVDIAALEEELERAQGKMAEQAAVIQCLDKDLNTVGRLVEDTVGDIASNRGGTGSVGGGALDACAALDPMNELHVKSHLPAVDAVDAEMAALHWHCAQCKHAMGACVHRQLQSISALQSQIHQTRNKQAGFQEWGKQQEQKFRELRIARRIPRVYRACLAEVARRLAFQEMYAAQAGKLAERMARHREREVTRRERFTKSHERYLPPEVVAGLGLGASPPQCEVTVTRSSEETIPPLAPVTEEDLRRIGADARTAWMDPTGADVDQTGADVSPPESPARSPVEAAAAELLGSLALDDGSENDDEDKDGEPGVSLGDGAMTRSRAGLDGDLFLENARLRADLAANVALLATIDGDRVRASKSAQTSQVLRDTHATGVGVQTSRGTLAMGRSMQTSLHSSEGIGVQTSQTLEGVSTQTSQVLESEETRSETARVLAALHAREEEAGALRRELRRVTAVLRQKESYVESLERAADATRGSIADPGRSPTPDPLSALM